MGSPSSPRAPDPPLYSRGRYVTAAAIAMLALMGVLMFASAWNDTVTFDEEPHIGAGYAYLRKADARLNPEHPPLMKDLAAFPLLFLHLRAPWDDKRWIEGQFEEWTFGQELLFNSGADPDLVMRAARAPIILFTVAFGWLIFW